MSAHPEASPQHPPARAGRGLTRRRVWLALAASVVLNLLIALLGPGRTLDPSLYYTGDQARAFLAGLGAAGAHRYLTSEALDVLFTGCYTYLFYAGLARLYPRGRGLAFVPGLFDNIENAGIMAALATPGHPHAYLDWLGIATCLKWVSFTAVAGTIALRAAFRPASAG